MLELDHVVIAAADLEAAAVVLEERYGLHSVEGGRHRLTPEQHRTNARWKTLAPRRTPGRQDLTP
jgi:hypothetical protein